MTQLTLSGARPVTLLAVKVTCPQVTGAFGTNPTPETAGAGLVTTTLWDLELLPRLFTTFRLTVWLPGDPNETSWDGAMLLPGVPSWNVQVRAFPTPLDVSVKVTLSPG